MTDTTPERIKRGPKTLHSEGVLKRTTVTLDQATIDFYKNHSPGSNLSEGIRMYWRHAKELLNEGETHEAQTA